MDLRQATDLLTSRLLTREADPVAKLATKAATVLEPGADELTGEVASYLARATADQTQDDELSLAELKSLARDAAAGTEEVARAYVGMKKALKRGMNL